MQHATSKPTDPQFFYPMDPIPHPAAPPSDGGLAQRIMKLVQFGSQNGPQFIEMVREKQKDNHEYAFLQPHGEGHDYYRWLLYCTVNNHPVGTVPPTTGAANQAPPVSARVGSANIPPYNATLPPDVHKGFSQVLEALAGSKESIKNSQAWFMACASYADGLAKMMAERVMQGTDQDKQFHIIYLANDILFKGLQQRQQGQGVMHDPVGRAFLPVMGALLAATYLTGGKSDEVKQKLEKILGLWRDRNVFTAGQISSMETAMLSADPTSTWTAGFNLLAIARAEATALALAPPQQAANPSTPSGYGAATPSGPAGAPAAPSRPDLSTPVAPSTSGPLAYPHPGSMNSTAPYPPGTGGNWQQGGGGPAMNSPMVPVGGVHPGQWQHPQAPYPIGAPTPTWGPSALHPGPGYPAGGQYPPQADAYWTHGQPPVMHGPPQQLTGGPLPGSASVPHGLPHTHFPGGPPHTLMGPAQHPQPPPPRAPSPPPEPKPVSSFSFPPGLIPKLVRDKAKHSDVYSPLSPLDIDDEGLPPPPHKDAYLQSRLESFHAEIKNFRPGVTRSDLEDKHPGMRAQREEAGDHEFVPKWRRGPGDGGADPHTGMLADGSYAGGPGGGGSSQYAGLGSHTRPEDMDDIYSSYRRMRSDHYHEGIIKSIPTSTKVAPK